MPWSTTGAESLIRRVLAPLLGLGGFVYETIFHHGDPRWLIISASLTLAIGGPLAQIFDERRQNPVPPVGDVPGLPPSPTDRTGGP